MKLNKKAEISIVIIIILALVGILIGVKTGFFGIFQPPQPDMALNSIVNKYYYDATSQPPIACQIQQTVLFRTTDLLYGSNAAIALSNPYGSGNLIGYGRTTGACTQRLCSLASEIQNVPGGAKVILDSNGIDYCVCPSGVNSGYSNRYSSTDSDASSVSKSTSSIDSLKEIIQTTPIKDAGIYACSGGNVATQYCGSFGATTSGTRPNGEPNGEICSLGCEYIPNYNIGNNVLVNTVKCSGVYKPNQNLCGTDTQPQTGLPRTLYKTDSTGTLQVTTCGFACNSGVCVTCKESTKRCASNTQIQVCTNGNWINDVSCSGLSQCSETGSWPNTAASCVSDFIDGEERCLNKQPQIFRTSTNSWQNKSYACTTQCQKIGNTADCVDQCTSNSCEAGALFGCTLLDSGNIQTQLATCISGQCNSDGKTCRPKYEVNKLYCKTGDVYKAIPDSSNPANGGVTLGSSPQVDCKLTCQELTPGEAECTKLPECVGSEGQNICVVGETSKIGTCNSVGDEVTDVQDCRTLLNNNRATCSVTNNIASCIVPSTECSGTFACKNEQMYSCSSGYFGTPLDTCNRLGCSAEGTGLPSNTNSQCNNDEDYVNRLNECVAGNSVNFLIKNVTDKDGVQYIRGTTTTCGTEGCDSTTGLCESQCTPGQDVCSGGKVYSCPSGSFGPEKYSCLGNLGCNTQGTACKNECEVSGDYQCIDETGGQESSGLCLPPDSTTGQRLLQKTTCGSSGCNLVTNRCIVAGNPGDYICKDIVNNFGGSIYQISTDGLNEIFRTSCNDLTQNGLNAFCKSGDSSCNYCIPGFDYCIADGTKKLICSDAYTGAGQESSCNAGCVTIGNSKYCDQLSVLLGKNNFRPEDNVLLSATLSGLPSNRFLSGKKVKFTLTGPGRTTQYPEVSTSADGYASQGYGQLSLGTYNAKIEFPEYPASYTKEFIVTITDDFIIQPQSQIIQLVPGVEHSIKVIAKKDTKAPTSLSIAETPPSGLTLARLESTGILGEWKLILEGEPGSYTLKIKADNNPSQDIPVQLVKPLLKIDSNIQTTSTLGSKNFDVSISGPKDAQGQIEGLVPNTITGSVTYNGQDTPITLATTTGGEGKYTTSYNFASEGTYTINVEATKEGYESIEKSFAVQVSSSGTVQPPGTDTGTGTGTGTGTTTGDVTGQPPGPQLPTQDIPQWMWIVGAGIAIYYFFGRKKR